MALNTSSIASRPVKNLLILLGILLATLIIYYPAINHDFIYGLDDDPYVTNNPAVTHFSADKLQEIFTDFFVGNYQPLTILSFALEYKAFDANPSVFHLTNLLLHLLNTALVFYFIYLLVGKIEISAVVALLFALHPLHVESVAWISERKDVLYGFFFLAGCITYTRFDKSGKSGWLLLCFLLFGCSLLSKSMAVTFPVVLVLIDFLLNKKFTWKSVLQKAPFFMLSIALGLLAITSQKPGNAFNDLHLNVSGLDRLFLTCYAISIYLVKLIVPFRLSVYNFYPEQTGNLFPWTVYLSLPFLLLIAWGIMKAKAYRRLLLFGTLFFLITISPVLQIIPIGRALTAERYTYLPYLGLFLILGHFTFTTPVSRIAIINRLQPYLKYLLFAWIFALSFLTWKRIGLWENGATLFTDLVKKYPLNYYTYFSRGVFYNQKGQFDKAITDFSRAIDLNPAYAEAYNNRASVWKQLKRNEQAMADLDKAIALKPDYALAYNNRGMLKDELLNYTGAIEDFDNAIKLKQDYFEAYVNRGITNSTLRNYANAEKDFTKVIDLQPDYFDAYINRGNVRGITGNFEGSIADFNKAIALRPNDPGAYVNRGLTKVNLKDLQGACSDWEKAGSLGDKQAKQLLAEHCHNH